jgi:hypothetical protein
MQLTTLINSRLLVIPLVFVQKSPLRGYWTLEIDSAMKITAENVVQCTSHGERVLSFR